MLVTKPILGKKDVVILDATKKGTEDRFTIVIEMKVKGTERTFKDVLFYDAANTNRISVLPAIIYALAEQTNLPVEKFRTETEESYDLDIDKVLKHIKGKEIKIERTSVVSERNGQTYYNVNYRPEEETEVEL
jgi:hypothetical protein